MPPQVAHHAAPDPGTVYWITGLPGAGKKTLAVALAARLRAEARQVVLLSGDGIREILDGRYGYGLADRRAISHAYGRLCRGLAAQGHDIVFSTVSLLHDVQRWNRDHLANYIEIYLHADPETLARRLPKGLLAAGLAGRIRSVPGVDLPTEPPERPDVVIKADAGKTAEAVAAELFAVLDLRPRASTPSRDLTARSWRPAVSDLPA